MPRPRREPPPRRPAAPPPAPDLVRAVERVGDRWVLLIVAALLDGPLVWFVPGAAVGVPGLLVLLFIALQAAGAMAWVPAVRRMSGDSAPSQRRRRPRA